MTDLALQRLAHDLRNELTGVLASLELLVDDETLSEGARGLLENALHSGQRMADLVEDADPR